MQRKRSFPRVTPRPPEHAIGCVWCGRPPLAIVELPDDDRPFVTWGYEHVDDEFRPWHSACADEAQAKNPGLALEQIKWRHPLREVA
jgi:hypothetical protein